MPCTTPHVQSHTMPCTPPHVHSHTMPCTTPHVQSHTMPCTPPTCTFTHHAMCHPHSCQPLLGVNLSPEFANLYFPYAGRVFCFFAGGSSILNSNQHVWQWNEEAMLCKIHMHDFKSHFQQDLLACCTRPVSVHVGCLFDAFFSLFAQFKATKSHESYVFLYPFSNIAISPPSPNN